MRAVSIRPMEASKAQTILEGMQVDGWSGVYVLGCIDRRVTVYSQQVRALNLAAALVASERVKAGETVVVVGGGVAGLTCAAGLRALGAEVIVLEAQWELLPLLRGGSMRWLHPGVYDWPLDGWDRDRAGLPVLDWEHGTVEAVRQQLEAAWAVAGSGVAVRCGASDVRLGGAGDAARKITWRPGGSQRTKTVVLAVGFGLEATPLASERRYWEGDDLDARRVDGTPRRWLVSGCGDGALTDLFRLCLTGFRHDRMLHDFTGDPRMAGIREAIRRIEGDAAIQDDAVRLHDAYAGLEAKWVVEAMQARRRADTKVKLAAPTADFLTRVASPLNRFLAGQLHAAGMFELVPSKVVSAEPDGAEVVVRYEDETSERFDRIQRRHGPVSALAERFPAVARAVEADRAQRRSKPTLTDQTRTRFWVEGVFGEEVRGDPPRARSAPAPSGPMSTVVPPLRKGGPEPQVRELIDELARVVWDAEQAKVLAVRAGLPTQHVPEFKTALGFWTLVISEAENGRLPGGIKAVVDEAARQFPGNRVFTGHHQALEIEAYRRSMLERHRLLKLVGFDERVKVAIELRELYVPLDVVLDHGRSGRVIYSDAHHAKAHTERYAQCRRISMAEAFGLAREYGKRGLVLLGDPGSGKTTQLRRVLLQLLSSAEDGGGPEAIGLPADVLPVFLPLRNLRPGESLAELMQRELDGPLVKAAAGLAERLIARGRLLLLLDGLDEVADHGERDRVARWIEDLLGATEDCWLLVSSRYAGYTPDIKLDPEFLELHLRPLVDEQVQAFVENWYRVVEAAEVRIDGVEAGPGRAAALVDELRVLERQGEAQTYAMTHNPLLLTAICLVHRRGAGALPPGREALYDECTTVLLEGWRKRSKRLRVMLPAEDARRVLQPVALWMHGEDRRTQASAAELRAPVMRGFDVIGKPGLDPDELLRRVRDESGLLTGWGLDRYGFMHLGFQEYLAALELREAAMRGSGEALRELAGRFEQTWWREVILLMLAAGGPVFERFMAEVVGRPELQRWMGSDLMSRLLGQHRGAALQGLDAGLLGHSSPEVRKWWRRVRGLERAAGESKSAPRGGVELVFVPGGRFVMGSAEDDEMAWGDEKPQHEVELEGFWLARTLVTNAQYGEYLKGGVLPEGSVVGPKGPRGGPSRR